VTLAERDPAMTRLFASAPPLRQINHDALHSPEVTVANADPRQWLEENDARSDFVVVDFPDPPNFAIGKLYSSAFCRLADKHLPGGVLAVIAPAVRRFRPIMLTHSVFRGPMAVAIMGGLIVAATLLALLDLPGLHAACCRPTACWLRQPASHRPRAPTAAEARAHRIPETSSGPSSRRSTGFDAAAP